MLRDIQKSDFKKGTYWFRRFVADCKKISKYIRIVPIKLGFYRIYWKEAYVHEVYKEMPTKGYDLDDLDPRFEHKKYFEEFEDRAELTRKIKNYVEGYWDSIRTVERRVWMFKNDNEYYQQAKNAYQTMYIK